MERNPIEHFLITLAYRSKEILKVSSANLFQQFVTWKEKNKVEYDTSSMKFSTELTLLNIKGVGKSEHERDGNFRTINLAQAKLENILKLNARKTFLIKKIQILIKNKFICVLSFANKMRLDFSKTLIKKRV